MPFHANACCCKGYSAREIRSRASDAEEPERSLILLVLFGWSSEGNEIKLSGPIHVTSLSTGFGAGTKVKIDALRPADRPPGVLVQNEPRKRPPSDYLARAIEDRSFRR